ncbi:hypothetical protein AB0958_26270 [Streptomyces sp. NPDC006655]|uniref:hypothetical protein n=1 Tax=Streptomyces sp. NPDC006655 TaxID=3156898 RepID=UPI0034534C28
MGVFAWLLGKKPKTTEEPAAEVTTGVEPAEPAAESTAEEAAEATAAEDSAADAAADPVADAAVADKDDGSGAGAGPGTRSEPEPERDASAAAAESTEIPQQQSAREAADNEAGESART